MHTLLFVRMRHTCFIYSVQVSKLFPPEYEYLLADLDKALVGQNVYENLFLILLQRKKEKM